MKQFYTVSKSQLDELNRLDANELVKKDYSDDDVYNSYILRRKSDL